MEDWVLRTLARWPNVPALFGWLSLDRRGRWRIRGEIISRPQIVETIDRNYAADAHGRWYFQNGPQRGYLQLEYAPLILRATAEGRLEAHTGEGIGSIARVALDAEGSLVLLTERGAGLLDDADLDWALARLSTAGGACDEAALIQALTLPSGAATALRFEYGGRSTGVERLDLTDLPAAFGFVRDPQPLPGERAAPGDQAAS